MLPKTILQLRTSVAHKNLSTQHFELAHTAVNALTMLNSGILGLVSVAPCSVGVPNCLASACHVFGNDRINLLTTLWAGFASWRRRVYWHHLHNCLGVVTTTTEAKYTNMKKSAVPESHHPKCGGIPFTLPCKSDFLLLLLVLLVDDTEELLGDRLANFVTHTSQNSCVILGGTTRQLAALCESNCSQLI